MIKTIVIAEAGVNHNGSLSIAKALVDVAASAGADFIKFQSFTADKLVSKTAKKALYQSKNTIDDDDSQYNMLKKLELDNATHIALLKHSAKVGIQFLSTGFDEENIDYLDKLGIAYFKIPSGEITNKPFLQHIGRKGKPVILSTGMSNIDEVKAALDILLNEGLLREQITVLHCNTEYPTPMQDVNLKAMTTLKEALRVNIGYSDHTLGIEVPIAAVAMGATIIEKHFTLDRSLPGPDHSASLEPGELKNMIGAIRNIELALSGDGKKKPSLSEIRNIPIVRRSIFYASSLRKGHKIRSCDMVMKRPGTGVSPMVFEEYIGKILRVKVEKEQMLSKEDLE